MKQQSESNTRTLDEVRRQAVGRGNALNLDRILVPLDGAHRSEQILPFASMIADWFSGEITLFHSLPSTHPARGARPGQVHYPDAPHDRGAALAAAYLEEVVSRLGPHGVKSRWGIATGHAAEMITSRSATSSFGIVAIAAVPRSRSRRLFSLGLLDQLWKTTAVPLLIFNPRNVSLNGAPPRAPKSLIVPGGRRTTDSAMSMASALAGAGRSAVKLVLPGTRTDADSAVATENEILEFFSDDGVVAEIERAEGNLVEHVHSLQVANPGSWIVVGSKMRSGFSRSVFGSTADRLARDAAGPIVIVPNAKVTRQRMRAAHDATRDLATSL
ncbi:MAG: universal stress protein [Chloroflexi bacterium]|nr:universal stress protein [Chloroflexota bacterium]MCI0775381.1 universal stress protein [Chloroflexota bacterium]MCI0837085.1 universal stress protein [Chloroflexota bacterium]MCI0852367.1 universal stress protein [Chloroflexota bacterium]MCI0871589.1 universal stress protein [Chloroflexota bacterium]